MKRIVDLLAGLAIIWSLLAPPPASAQQPVVISQPAAGTNQPVFPITSSYPLPITCISGCGSSSEQNVNLNQLNGVALGSPSNYGTSPGAVSVPGVNAFITNSPIVGQTSQYPNTAVPQTASATGTTAATAATLTAPTGHTMYICGFSIRANATGATTNNATVAGTISGTLNFTQWTAPLASGLGVTEELFSPCVPASAVSTNIVVTSGAPGSGGVVSTSAWGYSL